MGIEQLRELLERLTSDPASVTGEELTQATAYIREQRDHFAGQEVSDDVLSGLEELRDARAAIRTVQDERAASAAELDEKRQGLLSEIGDDTAPDQPADSTQGDTEGGQPAESQAEPSGDQPTVEATDQPTAVEPQAVAASAKPTARRAPIGAFRTTGPRPPQEPRLVARTVVTAAGGSPGFTQGQEITSSAHLAKAFAEKIRAMTTGRVSGGDKVYVANATTSYPDDRLLRAEDWVGNWTKMERATSPTALTAAGGICEPLQPLYDVEVIGSTARPVRDSLARFGLDRGGIQYRPPVSAATVLADATGVWSDDQDSSDAGDTKGCYEVACPGVETALIHAVWLCLEFSNISARTDPESTAANVEQGMIAHARRAENQLLRLIQAESKVLSAPKVIGAARDLLANVDKAAAYYRNRHRIDTDVSMTCILPAWVRYMMRTDVARQMAAGDWLQALGVADAQIDQWFRNRSVSPVWHLDGGIGGTNEVQTVTVTGTPTGGTYTLILDGQTTSALDYNATAAEVEAALEELSNIDVGDLTVAGGPHPGTAITVAFGGSWELTDVPLMTADDALLTGGTTPAVGVATTTAGSTTTEVSGVSIASQVYANAAAGTAIPGYPNQVDALLFPAGKMLFLDQGTLDLGLVRDSTLNSRNRYRQFSESFEGIANRAVEPLRLAMTVQPTGQTAGTKDTDAIAD